MKIHVVHGFPQGVDTNWLAALHSSTATNKTAADKAATYYNNFYGGLRPISVISFKIKESNET